MTLNVKLLNKDAVLPAYAKPGDSGMDLVATERTNFDTLKKSEVASDIIEYGTGIAVEIPEGFEGQIRPRSSISKYNLILANGPGTIDSGYRGEIKVRFRKTAFGGRTYRVGDKIAQLVIAPVKQAEIKEIKELSTTARGQGSFGSTGQKAPEKKGDPPKKDDKA